MSVHPPKTPVTEGSMGTAKATTPNICKMPGPPAPFVPTPLPNIAKSGWNPKGYSTTVKIEGAAVAILGASFESFGDMASKALGGGILSFNTHGPAKFITPGSLTVWIETRPVHLLGEPMLNNCGIPGLPPNTGATLMGLRQAKSTVKVKPLLECGEVGPWAELNKKDAESVDMERDHIPSVAAMVQRAKNMKKGMKTAQIDCVRTKVRARGMAVAIPRPSHRGFSPTCASKNKALFPTDAKSDEKMKRAVDRDTSTMQEHLNESNKKCAAPYRAAAKKIKEFDFKSLIKKAIQECT